MIYFEEISIAVMHDEAQSMLRAHWEELGQDRDKIPLIVNWDTYFNMEAKGELAVYGVYDEAVLIGYSIYFLFKSPHYDTELFAKNDVIYLHPPYRKEGIGCKFMEFIEQELKSLGVDKITYHVKPNTAIIGLLEEFGFTEIETIYGKFIGD